MTSQLWEEIRQQPEVLAEAITVNRPVAREVAEWASDQDYVYALIAARGTSDNAARYAQYLWGHLNRINVALAAPSLFGPLLGPPNLEQAIVVGISQSGESPDLVAVLEEGRRQGRPTLAMTNHADSPMAQAADRVMQLRAGAEKAVAATKTYTTELVAIALLSAAMLNDESMNASLGNVPHLVGQVVGASEAINHAAAACRSINRCVVLARGYHQSTAFEWALKMAELTYVVAQPFSTADFRHGPIAMIEQGFPVMAVSTSGPLHDEVCEVIADVIDAGARVVAITDDARCPATDRILLPPSAPWLSPLVSIVAAQIFTYHLAKAKGLDPDLPRGLRKVTKTR
ncbi:MAG TPA: SIS domain-containing protein [Acidimicrobiia bacterium]|nr:SIS domain-containing protein [Acidimicrobiia bacterium]